MKRSIAIILILVLLLALFTVDVFGSEPQTDTDTGEDTRSTEPADGGDGTSPEEPPASDPPEETPTSEAPAEQQEGDGEETGEETGEDENPDAAIPAAGGALPSGSYTLTEDLSVSGALTVASGEEVVIDLNGHSLRFSGHGFVNNGKLTVLNGSVEAAQYAFETNAGSVTELRGVTVNVTGYGILVVNDGTVTCSGCQLTAKSYPVGVYNGSVTLTDCGVSGLNTGVYTNQKSSGNVTLQGCTVQGSTRALNHWGNGTVTAKTTTFISDADPCLEANKGTVTLTDHCVLKRSDGGLSTFENKKECKFDFDPTTEFNGTWDDYHSEQWIQFVQTKYPDGIPETDYAEDGETVHIYSADGLAWFAYQLTVQRTSYVGKTVSLENDVNMGGLDWRATIGTNFVNATFEGNGHTIRNLKTNNIAGNGSGTVGYGFIGDMSGNSGPFTIRNVSFDGAKINGTIGAGVVLGCWGCDAVLDNVHVLNSYTRAHKSGGLAGVVDDGARNITIRNCSVEGSTVDTTSVHIRAGGLIGRVESGCAVNISGTHVSNTTIDASFYAGGLIGAVEHGSASVILDADTSVSGITLPKQGNYTEIHSVSVDGETSANTRGGQKNVIVDGLYLDGGKYGSSLKGYYWGAYGTFYIWGPPPTTYDAAYYLGSSISEHYGEDAQLPIANLELSVGPANYDYSTHTVKPSVIYYAVYDDGTNSRNVLYGYEYVAMGSAAAGKTMYTDLDCSAVAWYTDAACTQAYDMSTAITGNLTLYPPLELHDGKGKIDPERLSAGEGVLPKLDGAETTWIARQKGTKDIKVTKPGELPDMTLKLYASYVVTFHPNGGALNGPETVNVPASGKVAKPADPTRTGQVFAGWYTAAEGGVEWNFDQPVKKTMTLYAHWNAFASLTIVKTNTDQDTHSFLYRVEGEGVSLTVAITGNGSVTIDKLPIGEYKVTELSSWSWRYELPESQNVSLAKGDATVTFTNGIRLLFWLSGQNFKR